MRKTNAARLQLITTMALFGTIGIFKEHIVSVPSGMIALTRGVIGSLFLLAVCLIGRKGISLAAIKSNLIPLLLSGAFIGLNWVLLFESYEHTTVPTATLCYYMAPLFVVLASPFVLKEKLTIKKGICVIIALIGMVFVSGILQEGIHSLEEMQGIFFGLGAAVLYATVILFNTKIKDISPYDKTILQLAAAAVVMIPYCLLVERNEEIVFSPLNIVLLLTIGILHTGIAYTVYFGAMENLPAQTTAIFSYVDPVVAIILSVLILRDPFDIWSFIGAILILGAALVSELPDRKSKKGNEQHETEI